MAYSRSSPPTKKGRELKWTWRKPKDKPKRNLSAYNMFIADHRPEIMEERLIVNSANECDPDYALLLGAPEPATFLQVASERWKNLDPKVKEMYKRLAYEEKQRYKLELAQWEREKAGSTQGSSGGSKSPQSVMGHDVGHTKAATRCNVSVPQKAASTTPFFPIQPNVRPMNRPQVVESGNCFLPVPDMRQSLSMPFPLPNVFSDADLFNTTEEDMFCPVTPAQYRQHKAMLHVQKQRRFLRVQSQASHHSGLVDRIPALHRDSLSSQSSASTSSSSTSSDSDIQCVPSNFYACTPQLNVRSFRGLPGHIGSKAMFTNECGPVVMNQTLSVSTSAPVRRHSQRREIKTSAPANTSSSGCSSSGCSSTDDSDPCSFESDPLWSDFRDDPVFNDLLHQLCNEDEGSSLRSTFDDVVFVD